MSDADHRLGDARLPAILATPHLTQRDQAVVEARDAGLGRPR
ncbi:hypothetical protein ACIQMV_16880 [Streptomyces sp. NPDC091412]